MGAGSLREAGEERAGGGYPKGAGAGRNGKTFATLAQYFSIGKAHRGGNCFERGKGTGSAGCGRQEVQGHFGMCRRPLSFTLNGKIINKLTDLLELHSPGCGAYKLTVTKYLVFFQQGTFLTFRPDPFVSVTFAPPMGSFDAGDRVQYDLTLKNNDQSTTAHELSMLVTFQGIDTNRVYISCSSGSPTFNATRRESKLFISSIAPSQTVYCNYTSFLQDRISPKRLISQMVTIEYYSMPVSNSPQNFASYKEKRHANLTTKPINTTILASQNAEMLQAGDPVNFTLHLEFPECVTKLNVGFNLPAVPRSVIDLFRKRRDVTGQDLGSEETGHR